MGWCNSGVTNNHGMFWNAMKYWIEDEDMVDCCIEFMYTAFDKIHKFAELV